MSYYWVAHPLSCILPQPEGNSYEGMGHMWDILLAQDISSQGNEGVGMVGILPLASGISSNPG
jgi:hypothetical protein